MYLYNHMLDGEGGPRQNMGLTLEFMPIFVQYVNALSSFAMSVKLCGQIALQGNYCSIYLNRVYDGNCGFSIYVQY